jgi:hypothetical protein
MEDPDWAGAETALRRFGLPAKLADRPAIIAALEEQIRLETDFRGDQNLLRLLCAQLFSLGMVEDSLLVWRAKSCNFDTHCGIDVALLCGAGLEPTKAFFVTVGTKEADNALKYIQHCEACGDFAEFSFEDAMAEHRRFYHGETGANS